MTVLDKRHRKTARSREVGAGEKLPCPLKRYNERDEKQKFFSPLFFFVEFKSSFCSLEEVSVYLSGLVYPRLHFALCCSIRRSFLSFFPTFFFCFFFFLWMFLRARAFWMS